MAGIIEITSVTSVSTTPDRDRLSFGAVLSDLVREVLRDPEGDTSMRLRTICRQLPLILWATDETGTVVLAHGGGLARTGVSDDAAVGAADTPFRDMSTALVEQLDIGHLSTAVVDGHVDGLPWRYRVYATARDDGSGVVALALDATIEVSAERQERDLSRSEEQFQMLAESSPIGIVVLGADGRFEYVNPAVVEITGRPREHFIGLSWSDSMPASEQTNLQDRADAVYGGDGADQVTHHILRPDGTSRWVRSRAVVLEDQGEDVHGGGQRVMATLADITESLVAAEQLRVSNERTQAIIESAAEGIVTCDESGTVVEFNAAAEKIFGLDSDDAIGTPIVELIWPGHRSLVRGVLSRAERQEGVVGDPAREVNVQRPDGTVIPVEIRISSINTSSGTLFTGMIRDISERRAFERAIEHQATHDHLTGLPNRALFLAHLDRALARANRRATSVAVLFFELERVEVVIGSLGHSAADEVLREGARRLQSALGADATISRLSAGQFVALIEDRDTVADIVLLAQRGVARLDDPFAIGEEEVFLSSPVGIAFAPVGSRDGEGLISNGDVAMRRAKERTDQRLEVFDTEMREWVESRRKLEVALRYGIDRAEFELRYQPIVSVHTGRLVGVEALARWNHPSLGLLAPSNFIPLAEDSGLIVPLGDALMRDACAQLALWQKRHPNNFVSVNLSGHQLGQPDLVNRVEQFLSLAGADPAGLHFEITETLLLADVEAAAIVLRDLKRVGVKLSLDDFGTGYSSLTYLCRLPIDVVKIDRSFVSQLGTRSRDSSIVTMIVDMAQTLRLGVVAEGVETREQLDLLAELDCEMAQGYFHGRAVHPSSVEDLFDHQFEAGMVRN